MANPEFLRRGRQPIHWPISPKPHDNWTYSSSGSRISHRGANSKGAHDKLIFGQFSPENCMKIKGNQEIGPRGGRVSDAPLDAPRHSAGARSKNSAANHSTFQKTSELFSIGGGHVVPVVNNTTCFSIYKWLLFLLLFSSYFPLLSHSFLE